MPSRGRLCGVVWVLAVALFPRATHPFDGVEHDLDDLTVSSQMELGDYQTKKQISATDKLKYELGEHPDLTGQTQREGTLRENVISKPISKNLYWARSGAFQTQLRCPRGSIPVHPQHNPTPPPRPPPPSPSFSAPIGFDYDITPGLGFTEAANFYEPVPAEEYGVNVIVDPCRGHPHDCCQDVFGKPQYVSPNSTRVPSTVSALVLVDEQGSLVPHADSRLVDQVVHFDPDCEDAVQAGGEPEAKARITVKKSFDGFGSDVYSQCIGHNLAMDLHVKSPRCWDHNTTVNATLPCKTVGGDVFPSCVAVGYMSSAYIVQCGGAYREDDHCGTFIELHEAQSSEAQHGKAKIKAKSTCDSECNQKILSQVDEKAKKKHAAGHATRDTRSREAASCALSLGSFLSLT
jgi:hypothetical protein